jgi:membrane protein DedA with SNARE-associated domain
MLHGLIAFWFRILEEWGYAGIVVLMAMESSIFPVPSEVVMPPAAYWVTQGRMSFWGVVLAGTFGSWLGSAITYWVARGVGRAVIERYGKWVHITASGIDRAERMLHRYEAGGVFFSRLLPVVRHLISIPAGILRMDFMLFSVVTTLGAFLWCWILTRFSLHVFEKHAASDLMGDPAALVHVMKQESLPLVAGIAVLGALYFTALALSKPKRSD